MLFSNGSEWAVNDVYYSFGERAADPNTPEANQLRLYAKDNGSGISQLCYKNDAGTVICLPTVGPIVTGSGVSGRVAFWNGTSTLTSDSDLTFSVDTLTATKIIGSTSITTPSLTDSSMTLGSVLFAGTGGLVSQNNSKFFWDDSSAFLYLGTKPTIVNPVELVVHSVQGSGTTRGITNSDYTSDAAGPQFRFRKGRGTLASASPVQSADQLGSLFFGGASTVADVQQQGASIASLSGSLWTSTNSEGILQFSTTPSASITLTERFRIGSAGQWGIGGATFGTAGNPFVSGGASAAPVWRAGWTFNSDNRLSGGVVQLTPTYDLISSGHAALQYNNLGSVSTLTVAKAIDALAIEGTLSTTTTNPDQRNLSGVYIKMVDADNGTGDHRVRPLLALVQTSATAGSSNHKAAAIQGTAEATGSSTADLAGVTGETIAVASITAGRAFSFLATQSGVASKAVGLYFGDTGNAWYRGIDFTNATGFSDTAILLATNATAGKIAWSGGGSVGSSVNNQVWVGSPTVFGVDITSGSQSLALATSKTGGASISHTATQTQPNAGDTNDSAYSAGITLSASSAINELVIRGLSFAVTNNLTGGGAIQNLRSFNLAMNDLSSTTTTTMAGVFIERGAISGTVALAEGVFVADMGSAGTTDAIGVSITLPTAATNKFHLATDSGTGDTPATTWTAGVPNNNPAGYLAIRVTGNKRYIPFWT